MVRSNYSFYIETEKDNSVQSKFGSAIISEIKVFYYALEITLISVGRFEASKAAETQNGEAAVGSLDNINTAYMEYKNNSYDTNSGWKQASDTTTVYTYGLDISKVDEKNIARF